MHLKELQIENFRGLKNLRVHFDDTTILVGENNTGKTSILEAIRIALSRASGRRQLDFEEYDFHLSSSDDDPRKSTGIRILLTFAESRSDEWPEDVTNELSEIILTNPVTDLDSIILEVRCSFDPLTKTYATRHTFLNLEGDPLVGKAASATAMNRFFRRLNLFFLSALRNSAEHFSPRSNMWGKILKDIDIPDELREKVKTTLEEANEVLLSSQPKLADVLSYLERLRTVVSAGGTEGVSIRALPVALWDLMVRSEVVLRGIMSDTQIPLQRHGQGVQSLAVIFLLEAFVRQGLFPDVVLSILALEEPDAHLHPQATRAMWRALKEFTGQKIITTHSPYFLQNAPLRQVRILRASNRGLLVFALQESFSCTLRANHRALASFVSLNTPKFAYEAATGKLTVNGPVLEDERRQLLACFPDGADRSSAGGVINALVAESITHVSDQDLSALQVFLQHMRGEILFARSWILCEGQSDSILIQGIADAIKKPLEQHGVSVIDYQNNGSAGAFASLARAFGFPWLMFCDNDTGGNDHIEQLKNKHFTQAEIDSNVIQLTGDLEDLLIAQMKEECIQIANSLPSVPWVAATVPPDASLKTFMQRPRNKVVFATKISQGLNSGAIPIAKVPTVLSSLIERATQ